MIRFRRVLGGTSVLALLLSLTALASPAAATHVQCGDVITESITLDSDLGPCPGDGLVIAADNVTLDLGGHTIFAANGEGDNAGIRLRNVTGATVQNGTVTGFDAGVVIGRGGGNTVRYLTVVDNINDMLGPPCLLGEGIAILDSSNNTITRNAIIHNGPFGGVSVVGDSDANAIIRNEIHDNNVRGRAGSGCGRADQDEGVRIEGPGADNNIVDRNNVSGSLLAGIGIHGYVCSPGPGEELEVPNTGNVVTRNVVTGTAGSLSHGIAILQQGPADVVCPAFASTIERNTVTGNEGDGIFVSANSFDNQINRNLVEQNQGSGVYLAGPRFGTNFEVLGPSTLDPVSPDLPPYEEGTDYGVMFGSGSGDVTARLVPIDIALAPGADATNNPQPVDTSTSGCEPADYTAAGFQPGDIALIQRGTCTFVSKIELAEEMGASAVIMFNEGQAPGRITADFGSIGGADIPVLSASYPTGFELYQLTQSGPVTIRVATDTLLETDVQLAPGAYNNVLLRNVGQGNAEFDGFDGTEEPPCDNNQWQGNNFDTVNQPCVAAGGRGNTPSNSAGVPGNSAGIPGRSGDAPGHGGDLNNRGRGDRPASTPV